MTPKRVWVGYDETNFDENLIVYKKPVSKYFTEYIRMDEVEKALEEVALSDLYSWSPFGIVFANRVRKKLND